MTETNQTPKGKNTGMAILAYFIFFIPLLTEAKNDSFVKYHVKQGLLIFIAWVAVEILNSILSWRFYTLERVLELAVFVLMIIGVMTAAKGEEKPLPLIGKYGEQFKF
ncbi:MAG: hypothetical protein PHP03_01830 [Candidatus Pacebacteria bacterium]|nr:hypothetical protein [Candidatus Paceibacterota bacterium]